MYIYAYGGFNFVDQLVLAEGDGKMAGMGATGGGRGGLERLQCCHNESSKLFNMATYFEAEFYIAEKFYESMRLMKCKPI